LKKIEKIKKKELQKTVFACRILVDKADCNALGIWERVFLYSLRAVAVERILGENNETCLNDVGCGLGYDGRRVGSSR
jgi:hypothetical protein